jgi:hypothetical protein
MVVVFAMRDAGRVPAGARKIDHPVSLAEAERVTVAPGRILV